MKTLLAFSLGIIPAIIWLGFWLEQDKKNPEPKKFIILTFIAGMVSAIVAQILGSEYLDYYALTNSTQNTQLSLLALFVLATSEEVVKYIFAYLSALKNSFNDEPIDAVIYMITAALGFSAMENIMYLTDVLNTKTILDGIIVGNMRFIGATVLHTASSAIIGVALAFAYNKKIFKRIVYLIIGLILAITLHTSFNFLIINDSEGNIFKVFIFVWIIIMLLLLFFEKIKKIKNKPKLLINLNKKIK